MKAPKGYFTALEWMAMSDFERNVEISKYVNAFRDIERSTLDLGAEALAAPAAIKTKVRRKKSKYSRMLSKELKALNFKARTKSGRLRKGVSQANLLKKAHRNVKRRLKK